MFTAAQLALVEDYAECIRRCAAWGITPPRSMAEYVDNRDRWLDRIAAEEAYEAQALAWAEEDQRRLREDEDNGVFAATPDDDLPF
jgi:hypothetical protein